MKKFMNGQGKRLGAAGVGAVVANLIFALLVDQFGIAIHPNVVVTSTSAIVLFTNILVSKYFN
jgi:hypothetical protein